MSRMTPQPKRGSGDRILDHHCPDLSPEERDEALERLRRLAKVLITIEKKEAQRKARLEIERGGFEIDSEYICIACRAPAEWYSGRSLTCLPCHRVLGLGARERGSRSE